MTNSLTALAASSAHQRGAFGCVVIMGLIILTTVVIPLVVMEFSDSRKHRKK